MYNDDARSWVAVTIKDVFRAVHWPTEFMQFRIGDKFYDFPRLHSKQKYSKTSLIGLSSSAGLAGLSEEIHEITVFYYCWMPADFQAPEARGYCLCNFGGCCSLCKVPSIEICKGCGNNGCCRTGDCGCDCCVQESKDLRPRRRCPISGCRPDWAGSSA